MRRTVLAAGLAVPLLLAGCAAPPSPPLSVSLDQSRDLENRHRLALRLTNDGDAELQVVRLQVRSDAWSTVPPTVREEVLAPGQRLAFPVAYGAADCARSAPATVVVGYRDGSALREARVPVPDDDPLLPRLHARQCALAELGGAAELSFTGWQRRGDVAVGELVVRRTGGDRPVTVSAVDGSVIVTLRGPATLPAVLGQDEVRIPVEAEPTRCDPHALAESKRTYVFAIAAALGDDPPLTVPVEPEPEDLPLLQQLLQDVCL